MKHHPSNSRGFTLIEVTLAVGIFAFVIIGIVAMLGPVARDTNEIRESEVASRLAASIERQLSGITFADITAAVGATPIYLVATADGSRVLRTGLTDPLGAPTAIGTARAAERNLTESVGPGIADRDRFFLIRVDPLLSSGTAASNPLRYDNHDGSYALKVTVSWPFRIPAGPAPEPPLPANWDASSVQGRSAPASTPRNELVFPISLPL